MKNHKKFVLNYLRNHKGISNREAIRMGVGRLSDVIFDLRAEGHIIETEMVRVDEADGLYYTYGVYHLIKEAEHGKERGGSTSR